MLVVIEVGKLVGGASCMLIMAGCHACGHAAAGCSLRSLDVLALPPDPVGQATGEEDPHQLDQTHTNGHA
jgi:hypothetical protein